MGDPTTIALNLTFLGTLAVALVMFFGLFLVFVATLVMAGLGRLATVTIVAVGRGLFRTASRTAGSVQRDRPVRTVGTSEPARPPKAAQPAKAAKPAKPAKKEPALSPDWAAAVVRADTRAAARAKSEAAPEVKVSVRDLPSPAAPARDVAAVAPLVESATDPNGQLGAVPAAFRKAPTPAASPLLDTGSLVSLPRPASAAPESPGRAPGQTSTRAAGPGAQSRLRPYPRQSSRLG